MGSEQYLAIMGVCASHERTDLDEALDEDEEHLRSTTPSIQIIVRLPDGVEVEQPVWGFERLDKLKERLHENSRKGALPTACELAPPEFLTILYRRRSYQRSEVILGTSTFKEVCIEAERLEGGLFTVENSPGCYVPVQQGSKDSEPVGRVWVLPEDSASVLKARLEKELPLFFQEKSTTSIRVCRHDGVDNSGDPLGIPLGQVPIELGAHSVIVLG